MGNERPGVLPCFPQTGAQVCSVHCFCNSAPLTGQSSFILYSIFPYLRLPIYLCVWAAHRVGQFTKRVCSLHVNSLYSGYSAYKVFLDTLM